MVAAALKSFSGSLPLDWLTGPILDKELRVSSRRRRNYALRSAYVLCLLFFIVMAWVNWTASAGGGLAGFRASRMAEAGKSIILTVTWFQFIAAQLIAIVMLSNSISDEIRRGTLSVLMATPINSVQIVLGKLFSRLLQLFGLLGISLSTLAVVRVFGGVQWTYVVASLCITLTAVLFAASLSLFFSITARRPYSVILIMLIILVFQYGAALLSLAFFRGAGPVPALVALTNPFAAMFQASSTSIWQMPTVRSSVSWGVHCLFMLLMSIAILMAAVLRMRRSMLSIAFAPVRARKTSRLKNMVNRFLMGQRRPRTKHPADAIKTSPLIWKELGRPFWPPAAGEIKVLVVLSLGLILGSLFWGPRMGMGFYVWYIYIAGLSIVVSIRTAAMAAVSITGERDSRTWAALLGTPLTNWQIVRDKILTVIARNRAGWIALLIHPVVFYISFMIRSALQGVYSSFYFIIQIPVSMLNVAAHMLLLVGAGLYFSMRLKSSTAAIIAAVSVELGMFFYQRLIFTILFRIIMTLPLVSPQLAVPIFHLVHAMSCAAVGILLIWRTKCGLRKHIFVS